MPVMPRYDFRTPRLYLAEPLGPGVTAALNSAQANYLANVLRLKSGDSVLVFNGHDGEWRAHLEQNRKGQFALAVTDCSRTQTVAADLHYLFAPLKHARLDYLAQKAVEMGASRLQPVVTRHVQVARINLDRMRANAIEAAEQCGILTLPDICAPLPFERMLRERDPARLMVFCDEEAPVENPIAALSAARGKRRAGTFPLALLIGPEGGFAQDERTALLSMPNVVRLALGPRILRAETAAVAALALMGAVLGDWS
jgi:16S rRNA (uracil1498-N3)-methyltransferase